MPGWVAALVFHKTVKTSIRRRPHPTDGSAHSAGHCFGVVCVDWINAWCLGYEVRQKRTGVFNAWPTAVADLECGPCVTDRFLSPLKHLAHSACWPDRSFGQASAVGGAKAQCERHGQSLAQLHWHHRPCIRREGERCAGDHRPLLVCVTCRAMRIKPI